MQKTKLNSALKTLAFSIMVTFTLSAFISINNTDNDCLNAFKKQQKPEVIPLKGTQNYTYTLKTLPSGAYELKICNNKNPVTKKVIIE